MLSCKQSLNRESASPLLSSKVKNVTYNLHPYLTSNSRSCPSISQTTQMQHRWRVPLRRLEKAHMTNMWQRTNRWLQHYIHLREFQRGSKPKGFTDIHGISEGTPPKAGIVIGCTTFLALDLRGTLQPMVHPINVGYKVNRISSTNHVETWGLARVEENKCRPAPDQSQ